MSHKTAMTCQDGTMFVVTMTQRSAEPSEQRVSDFHQDLKQLLGDELPASRSSDPLIYRQVFTAASPAVEMALYAMRLGTWNVGIESSATEHDDEPVGPGASRTWLFHLRQNKVSWCHCALRRPSLHAVSNKPSWETCPKRFAVTWSRGVAAFGGGMGGLGPARTGCSRSTASCSPRIRDDRASGVTSH